MSKAFPPGSWSKNVLTVPSPTGPFSDYGNLDYFLEVGTSSHTTLVLLPPFP